jgi:leucine dehydrogenase
VSADDVRLPLLEDKTLEDVHFGGHSETGLRAYIAIHSTARGPAFGGCRLWTYADEREALSDAMRLAEGMSYKNALAGLPFGGGKAVIIMPPAISDRRALFKSFGREVQRLGGRYITAEDVGTTTEDMRAVRSETSYVSGIPRAGRFGGDPSRFTALGVFLAIQTAVRMVLQRSTLQGVTIGVQGVGAVGARLCALLASAGAKLFVADLDRGGRLTRPSNGMPSSSRAMRC